MVRVKFHGLGPEAPERVAVKEHAAVQEQLLPAVIPAYQHRPVVLKLVHVKASHVTVPERRLDRRQLVGVPAQHQLQASERLFAVAHRSQMHVHVVEELSGDHRYLVDDENFQTLPELCPGSHLKEIESVVRNLNARDVVQGVAVDDDGGAPSGRRNRHLFLVGIAVLVLQRLYDAPQRAGLARARPPCDEDALPAENQIVSALLASVEVDVGRAGHTWHRKSPAAIGDLLPAHVPLPGRCGRALPAQPQRVARAQHDRRGGAEAARREGPAPSARGAARRLPRPRRHDARAFGAQGHPWSDGAQV
mmetsp:Transcript_44812/g.128374  ORF Transcript_44812/g.128374 Transcript_44812/m.128374 type:complete len:306 (-) Transcript_44812:31-948(-)